MPVYKIDLHNHCSCDPVDQLSYSAKELIDRAKQQNIHALAITPHRDPFIDPEAIAYAKKQGILLIPGVERFISGKEIVILNASPSHFTRQLTFADLEEIRASTTEPILTIAPHPFYPRKTCLGKDLHKIHHLIDAIEYAHLYTYGLNFPNNQAVAFAQKYNKPIIANSDSHSLKMLGRNSSLIEIETDETPLTTETLFTAIKAGKTTYAYRPYTIPECFSAVYQTLTIRKKTPLHPPR